MMKSLMVNIVSVVAILAISISAYAGDSDVYKNDGEVERKGPPKDVPVIKVTPDFKVVAKIPDVPSVLPVYAVKRVDPTMIDPNKEHIAQVFHFEAQEKGIDEKKDGSVSVMFTDSERRSIEYFSSGAAFFMEEQLFDERAEDLLAQYGGDRNEVARVFQNKAYSFIKKNDLANPGMVFNRVSFVDAKQKNVKSKTEKAKVVAAAAHFGYELDGVPAWGPGAKTSLYFGENGVSGFYNAAPALDVAGEIETLHPEKALDQYIGFGKASTMLRLHSGVVEQVVIESMELVYFIDAGNKNQNQVTPHYLLKGTFYGNDIASKENGMIETEFEWLAPATSL